VTARSVGTAMLVHACLPPNPRTVQLMAMPAAERRHWTAAEVRRLIDDHDDPMPRFELVQGALLVTPAPSRMHQRIVLALARLLHNHVEKHHIGEVSISPSDIRLAPELIVQPDLFVVPAIDGHRPRADDAVTKLLLAVEVLSPGSARYDRVDKRREYQRTGVPGYWIVDPDGEVFERWQPADERPELVDAELAWLPAGASEPFVLDVAAFFAEVADDPATSW
jgi:Uma2 family endonuclease